MARKKPNYISPSGGFISHLYREQKRSKLYHSIIKDLPLLLNSSLIMKVPESEPGSALNINYFSSKCDLQNPRCVERINFMEARIRKTVDSIIVPFQEATTIADSINADLKRVLRSRGYHVNSHLYGSYFTGLSCKDSDVDVIIEFRKHDSRNKRNNILSKIADILRSFPKDFSKVKLISRTRVPFIRFIHNRSQKECDATFENKMGIQNSKLIKLYLTLNPNLKTLTLYIKHLLNKYGIRGIGRITTHILFWMVVFFMQQKGLLPAVKTIREACSSSYAISGTNCAVPDSYVYYSSKASSVNTGLCSLLLDFAAFYRDFKFMKYVMSPHFGKAYPIYQAEELKEKGGLRSFITSFVNLQHPSDFELNLTKQTRIRSVNMFKKLCCHLSKILLHYMKFSKECNRTLDDMLPEELPYMMYQPKELIQYTSLQLKIANSSKRLTGHVIRTVRYLMENVFSFKAKKIFRQYVSGVDVPTVYFSYCSTPKTWDNKYIRFILPRPRYNKLGEPDRQINVFLICEIIAEKDIVKIIIESEAHFMTFLDEYARSLLKNVSNMIA